MELSLCENDLKNYLASQLNTFFPDGKQMVGKDVDLAFQTALDRLENCFKRITFLVYSQMMANGNPAPIFGKGLFFGAGANIIGDKKIGDRVSISVDTVVHNQRIDDDKVVITDINDNTVIKDRVKEKCMAQNYFREEI